MVWLWRSGYSKEPKQGPKKKRTIYNRLHGLTPRETEVIEALAIGISQADIARQRGIKQETVQDQVRHIMDKLYACTTEEAVRVYSRLTGPETALKWKRDG